MLQVKARLVERQRQGAAQTLRLHSPDLAARLSPGQAVLIQTGWGLDPYLRRAFYPVALDAESWAFRLPPSGDRGHAWLRMAPVGVELDCLGPVGIGFRVPEGINRLLCLGEGEWAWALLPFVAQADAHRLSVTLAAEASTARHAIPARQLPLTVEYRLATVDGSKGRKGRLISLLPDLIRWADAIVAAGSISFYHRLADAVQQHRVLLSRAYAQALYPGSFLCGNGACLACVADIAGGRRRVCLRGPVFDLVDFLR